MLSSRVGHFSSIRLARVQRDNFRYLGQGDEPYRSF